MGLIFLTGCSILAPKPAPELEKTEVKPDKEKTADEKLLSGPQIEGKGVTQDEIDKLFQ